MLRDHADLHKGVHEIYRWLRAGHRVVAVVSAFEGTTDRLLTQARETVGTSSTAASLPADATALLLATGEFTTASLLSLALARAGVPSKVLSPQALQLRTKGHGTDADPASINREALLNALAHAPVAVVPGFIGLNDSDDFTLLGRGGSDLTALFIASELSAARCRLIKDVDGLYDRDPAIPGPPARRYRTLHWNDALRLDGGIVQHKAVRVALQTNLTFEVGAFGRDDVSTIGNLPAQFDTPSFSHTPPPLSLTLLGNGTVGAGVRALLAQFPDQFQITSICTRDTVRAAATGAPAHLLSTNPIEAARTGDVVVELLGGIEPAETAIETALARGAHVVTANKAIIAGSGPRLASFAESRNAQLLYSAAAGGSVPMIESVRLLRSHPITRIEGILNGTTNYILNRIAQGLSFDAALKEAQTNGYAEADPSRDLQGIDAAEKLVILIRELDPHHAPDLSSISREPLNAASIATHTAQLSPEHTLRLVASAERTPTGWRCSISLRAVPPTSPLAHAPGTENHLVLTTAAGTITSLRGSGAGRWPTAESVFGDLLDLWRAHRAAHLSSPITTHPQPTTPITEAAHALA